MGFNFENCVINGDKPKIVESVGYENGVLTFKLHSGAVEEFKGSVKDLNDALFGMDNVYLRLKGENHES